MAAIKQAYLVPAVADTPTTRQRLFAWYLTAILIDLTILNLFVEFSTWVTIDSFSVSLLAAIVLQVLLKLTIAIEHRVAAYFNPKPGGYSKFMRFFCAWLVLFGSKFVILEAIDFMFGDRVDFEGPFQGIVALILVIVAMLAAEECAVRLYRRLE
jgi:hypothetical protein